VLVSARRLGELGAGVEGVEVREPERVGIGVRG
jgi:hypothetical protein